MTDKQNYFTYTDNTSDDNDKIMENLHKQIIIDGVDVSWCEYYRHTLKGKDFPKWCIKTHINYGDGCKYQGHCYNFPYCFYKEGKRENEPVTTKDTKEDLKTKVKQLSVMVKCSYDDNKRKHEQLKAKEQECEGLKSDNLQEVGQLKFAIGTLTAENLHLKELLDMRIEALCDSCKAGSMLPIKCRIYEKALTEIKEIAENQCVCGVDCIDMKQILQKISEVEDD